MRCVHRYDEVVERSRTEQELLDGFADRLVETIADEAPMHRLWYDLRVESMFDERLLDTVLQIEQALEDMIWRIVTRYAELADREVAMDPTSAYAVLDGLFQAALFKHVTGDAEAVSALVRQVHNLLPMTLGPLPHPARVGRSADPLRVGPLQQRGADLGLQHLADLRARQVRPDLDLLGRLDAADPLLDERRELVGSTARVRRAAGRRR